jgi:hypothetical protein
MQLTLNSSKSRFHRSPTNVDAPLTLVNGQLNIPSDGINAAVAAPNGTISTAVAHGQMLSTASLPPQTASALPITTPPTLPTAFQPTLSSTATGSLPLAAPVVAPGLTATTAPPANAATENNQSAVTPTSAGMEAAGAALAAATELEATLGHTKAVVAAAAAAAAAEAVSAMVTQPSGCMDAAAAPNLAINNTTVAPVSTSLSGHQQAGRG